MRQSLHAVLLASGVDCCSLSVSAVALLGAGVCDRDGALLRRLCRKNEDDQQQAEPTLKRGAVVLKGAGQHVVTVSCVRVWGFANCTVNP